MKEIQCLSVITYIMILQVAKDNGKPMLLGRLVVDDASMGRRGRVKDLLGAELRRTSLLLWFIWFVHKKWSF